MASKNHLKKISEGADRWNAWRRQNPRHSVNLRGARLQGKDLLGFNFNDADIRGTKFSKADLSGASFINAQAGLQKRWIILWFLVISVISILSSMLVGGFSNPINSLSHGNPNIIAAGALLSISSTTLLSLQLLVKGFKGFLVSIVLVFSILILVVIVGALLEYFLFFPYIKGATLEVSSAIGISIFSCASAGVSALSIIILELIAGKKGGIYGLFLFSIFAAIGSTSGEGFSISRYDLIATILMLGVYSTVAFLTLNSDRKYDWIRSVAVAISSLGGTSFYNATLINTDFYHAMLGNSDFRDSKMMHNRWKHAKDVNKSRWGNTVLQDLLVRELAISLVTRTKDWTGKKMNGLDLRGVNLEKSDLTGADLSYTVLKESNLKDANLAGIQALHTQFQNSCMTGACLEGWNTDSTTQLDGVICDYVYLLKNQKERSPKSGKFMTGEFSKLFENVFHTIDLVFQDGIDWQALKSALEEACQAYGSDNINIQGIERKTHNTFIVRLEVKELNNRAHIERDIKDSYEKKRKSLESYYREKLNLKENEIKEHRQRNTDMLEITKLLASRPPITVTVENSEVIDNSSREIKIVNSSIDGVGYVEGDSNSIFTSKDNSLKRVSQEIQELLERLSKTHPSESIVEKAQLAEAAIKQIEDNKPFAKRLLAALDAGLMEAISEALNHPAAAFFIAAIQSWNSSDSAINSQSSAFNEE